MPPSALEDRFRAGRSLNDAGIVQAIDVLSGAPRLGFSCDAGGTVKGFVFPNVAGTEIYLSTQNAVHRVTDGGTRAVRDWVVEVPGASIPAYPPGRQFLWVGSSNGQLYQLEASSGNGTSVRSPADACPQSAAPRSIWSMD